MELSEEIKSLLQKYRPTQCEKTISYNKDYETNCNPDDVIDIEQIDIHNDQTWLIETESIDMNDLNNWLYEDLKPGLNLRAFSSDENTSKLKKQFDSRTFTRPKKNFTRPSIEKYNEEYLKNEKQSPHSTLCDVIDNYILSHKEEEAEEKPLHFDLNQPVSGNCFEKILSTAPDLDSFQNMSPPSLVNSMCSSTFTNLMENSYIKNDPILREIRDGDYSSHDIFHDDPPLFQSITESCSSINSEMAENFVRKTLTSLNGTYRMLDSHDHMTLSHDDDISADFTMTDAHTENIDPNISQIAMNGTFRKHDAKLNTTFDKTAANNTKTLRICKGFSNTLLQNDNLANNTITIDNNDLNSTYDKNSFNNTFRKTKNTNTTTFNNNDDKNVYKLNETIALECHNDDEYFMNDKENKRLSAEIDEFLNEKLNYTYEKDMKLLQASRLSAESTDSLDRASSSSTNSKEYGQMLMAEVDAIVEQQERSLQIMSTPIKTQNKLFEHSNISPIHKLKEHASDSEISSDEFITARSAVSLTHDKIGYDRSVKSLSNIRYSSSSNNKKLRSINTVSSKAAVNAHNLKDKITYSNLRATGSKIGGSYTNLKTINTNLKGSYTNLKPTNNALPNISSKASLDVTHTLEGAAKSEFKVPQAPAPRTAPSNPVETSTKQQARTSSLPRPVSCTGIPRPLSKIPAPKTRMSSARLTRPTSKVNINDGLY